MAQRDNPIQLVHFALMASMTRTSQNSGARSNSDRGQDLRGNLLKSEVLVGYFLVNIM